MKPDPAKARWALAAAVAALALDLASKWLATGAFEPGESRELAPFFSLVLVENRGAAFSLFSGSGAGQGLKMTALAVVAMLPLAWFYRQARAGDRMTLVSLGAILGGALGNIHDRLRFDAVTDFLDLHWGEHHWPAFNLADVFVVAGVLWILGSTVAGTFSGEGSAKAGIPGAGPVARGPKASSGKAARKTGKKGGKRGRGPFSR
ncbi:MAG: signal peptidase II [Deltaproteobacteria bacterium]|nr:signal peptidase II [Deltaproteobacteria bacterium]